MQIQILKSKIHRATITEANLNYVGSITIDETLMIAANLIENEKVQVVNVNNGERLETYIIKGQANSGVICLNGPAARKAAVGDVVIIISYATMDFDEPIYRRYYRYNNDRLLYPIKSYFSINNNNEIIIVVVNQIQSIIWFRITKIRVHRQGHPQFPHRQLISIITAIIAKIVV